MSSLERHAIPGNILDRVLDLERRLDDLELFSAIANVDPTGDGDITYVEILQEIALTAGADIAITENAPDWTIARAGDSILLFDSSGDPVAEYAATSAGLTNALAAAASGDVVMVHAGTITGGPWTVASGVLLMGMGWTNSILDGNITVNGSLSNVRVIGEVTNVGRVYLCRIEPGANETGITQSDALAKIFYCELPLSTDTDYGIYVTGGSVSYTWVRANDASQQGDIGVYANGSDVIIHHTRSAGLIGAQIENVTLVENCHFRGTSDEGLKHTTGTAVIANSYFWTDAGSYDVNLTGAGLTLINCAYDTINGEANLTYGQGDRGAYSVEDYHANDIEAAALTRHLPAPSGAGRYARDDGTNWQVVDGIQNGDLPDPLAFTNAATILTIATGAVTATQNLHTIAAESGTADDLDTINGLVARQLLLIKANTGDTITVKHGTSNIHFDAGTDFELSGDSWLLLFYDGTNAVALGAGGGGTVSQASDLDTLWTPLTNGDTANPELVFSGGDVIMVEVSI